MDESQLLLQLKSGDPAACKLFVGRYGTLVYNTVLGLVQNQQDCEDLTQEVFSVAFEKLDSFREEARISTWLYRIAVTRALLFLRSKKRKKRFAFMQSIFGEEGAKLAHDPVHFQHPGVLLENQERAAILFAAIDQLPERQKTAFILHKLEDLSYAEIAAVMELSLSSVESLMFRAKQRLQVLLADYYEKNER